MIYGITGKIASGKNYVASLIELKEHVVIDLDQMAKDSYSVLADQIKAEFGTTDRKELSKIVFEDVKKRKALELIIYPYLKSEIKKIAKTSNVPVFINGALLRRSGLDKICECVIYVDASDRLRYIRAKRRSGMTREDFDKRNAAQKDVDYTKYEYRCPVEVIVNERNTHVRSELNAILKKYGLRTRRPRLFMAKEPVEIEEIQETVASPVVEKEPAVEKPVVREEPKTVKPVVEKEPKVEKPVVKEELKEEPKEEKTVKPAKKETVKEVVVETAAPVLSNEDMYIFPESVSPQSDKKEKKAKTGKKHPALIVLIILLLLGGGAFCFFRFISPSSLDFIQSKTSTPFEMPKISDLLENLSKKKDLKPVELPPEVKAPKAEKLTEKITEKAKEVVTEAVTEKAAEYGISEETVKQAVDAASEMPLKDIVKAVEVVEAVKTAEKIEDVISTLQEEVPAEVVEAVTNAIEEAAPEAVESEPVVEESVAEPTAEPVVETVTAEPIVSEPVRPAATNREQLHQNAIEDLPGDLKFILMTL